MKGGISIGILAPCRVHHLSKTLSLRPTVLETKTPCQFERAVRVEYEKAEIESFCGKILKERVFGANEGDE